MIEQPDIEALASRIAAEFHPQRIVLFGSRAYGTPRPDSDVDLLVVMACEGSHIEKAAEILTRVHPGTYPIDLVIRTPEEMVWRYKFGDPLIREVVDRGRVLYEAAA